MQSHKISLQKRACSGCTACCDGWVSMNIRGAEVFPGQPCPHSTGTGCNDYARRPHDPCILFVCGWAIEGSPLPEWMKPSEAGVIVLFNKTTWQGRPVDLAVPVGGAVPEKALAWLKTFAEQQLRPLIYSSQIEENGRYQRQQLYTAYGPPAFQQEVARLGAAGKALW